MTTEKPSRFLSKRGQPSPAPETILPEAAIVMAQEFIAKNPKGIITIAGPTASGKTGFSLQVAQELSKEQEPENTVEAGWAPNGTEVISVDSRQIYTDLDISSAAIMPDEMEGVPHHGLRIISPEQKFNSYDFQQYAYQKIEEIQVRGNVPILCGGTMLWLDAITQGLTFGEGIDTPKYPILNFAIHRDRGELYDRIDLRTDIMYDTGLIEEVKNLRAKYRDLDHNVWTSIGVAEACAYLDGICTLEEAKRITAKRTRKYAKRQLTWWRGRDDIVWVGM